MRWCVCVCVCVRACVSGRTAGCMCGVSAYACVCACARACVCALARCCVPVRMCLALQCSAAQTLGGLGLTEVRGRTKMRWPHSRCHGLTRVPWPHPRCHGLTRVPGSTKMPWPHAPAPPTLRRLERAMRELWACALWHRRRRVHDHVVRARRSALPDTFVAPVST